MAPRAVLTSQEPAQRMSVPRSPKSEYVALTLLHLVDHLLVKKTPGLLVKWAIDGDNITLSQHLFQTIHTPASNLLLDLGLEWLIVEVQELLAVKRLESPQHTLSDTADSDGADDLVLEIELVLGGRSNLPFTGLDLLVCGNEVADEGEDSHDNMFSNGYDVGTSDFGDSNTAVGGVCSVQVDVIRSDTGGNCNLEFLGFCETLCVEITRVEAVGDPIKLVNAV